jgi:CubicO group peptidase (beta-lactamase class C family)
MQTTPGESGLAHSGLDRARDYVAGCVERGEIAGAVSLVARHDDVAQPACVGLRDIEAAKPMEPDTIFRLASMTKPIVSVGVLMLVDAGKLRLDDPVARYIPDFADIRVFAGVDDGRVKLAVLERPITIHDLLTHMSGLAEHPPHPELEASYDSLGDEDYALPELMRRLAARPLAHQPGRGWTYGWSHHVLGRIIEVAADRPLDDYLDSEIFRPLGMVDTGFYVPPEKIDRLAAVYKSKDGRLHRVDTPWANRFAARPILLGGGGGLVSTAPDYVRFTRMLEGRGELGGARLLKPETVELMTRNHLPAPLYPLKIGDHVSEGEGYGLGFGVVVEETARGLAGPEGTYGWSGAWLTHFWIDPVSQLTGIFMVQTEPFTFDSVGVKFRSLVYEALASGHG